MTHLERFTGLAERLAEWQSLWRCLPFQHPRLPWQARWPGLAEALLALTDAEVARLQEDPFTDSPLAAWLPVDELAWLVALPAMAEQGGVLAEELPEAWGEQVGGASGARYRPFCPRSRSPRPSRWWSGAPARGTWPGPCRGIMASR